MNFKNPSSSRGYSHAWRICLSIVVLVSRAVAMGRSSSQKPQPPKPLAYFIDIAKEAGLTMMDVFGGVDTKKYIIETTVTGVAIFDYDNDGWPDIFIVNGTTLERFPAGKAPTHHLYHNNH